MRGRDKLLEQIDGEPLLVRTAKRALATCHPVIVTLPPRPHPRYGVMAGLPATLVDVENAAQGINASLTKGLAQVPDAEGVMILLADLPDITSAHLETIFAARNAHPDAEAWRGATESGKPGHPTLIDKSLFARISALTGDQGAQPVLKEAKSVLVPLSGRAARADLDTPEEWAAWRSLQDGERKT